MASDRTEGDKFGSLKTYSWTHEFDTYETSSFGSFSTVSANFVRDPSVNITKTWYSTRLVGVLQYIQKKDFIYKLSYSIFDHKRSYTIGLLFLRFRTENIEITTQFIFVDQVIENNIDRGIFGEVRVSFTRQNVTLRFSTGADSVHPLGCVLHDEPVLNSGNY